MALTLRPACAGVLSAFSAAGQGVVTHLARTRIRQEPGHGAWSANLHSGENESSHSPAREPGPRGQTLQHGAVPPHPWGHPLGVTQRRGLFGAVAQAPPGTSPWGASYPASGGGGHWAGQRGESPASGGARQPDPGAETQRRSLCLDAGGVRLQSPALTLSGRTLVPGVSGGHFMGL